MKKSSKTRKNKKQTLDFDVKKDNEYQVEFSLGPNVVQYLEFKLDEAECGNLTYDEVESKAYLEADKIWPHDSFPDLKLKQIKILCSETDEYCPVFAESMKEEISEFEKLHDRCRFLVLPDATYSLTPECALWMSMKEQGLLLEDSNFEFEKMHALLEMINQNSK